MMNGAFLNAAEFLLRDKDPERIALRFVSRDFSYGELGRAVGAVAHYLHDAGGFKGDRVLLIGDNSFFWVASYIGTLAAGLVSVPLPVTVSPQVLDQIIQTTGAKIAFIQAGQARKIGNRLQGLHLTTDRPAPAIAGVASQKVFSEAGPDYQNPHIAPAGVQPEDLAALMYTSGSTGKPRGVMVSHCNIMANTESIVEYLDLTGDDRIMAVLPFHYCFGTSLLHTHLRTGGSLVVDSRFMYPEMILQRMIETDCTGFAGVPSHYQILLRNSSLRKKTFPSLRYVQQAGGHLAPSFIRELREALPDTKIFVMYGQTEATARLSYLPPEQLDSKLGSIGKGIPGVKLRVLNKSGTEVKAGDVGEIVAEGKNIALGYWCDPDESANSFRDVRLYTGDLATVDDEGFIYVVDRAKDFLKCGGKRVSCRQLEDQLLAFEDLLEVAVIGVPDDVLGEAAKAFVVPRIKPLDGFEERLRIFCKQRMDPQFVPREIAIVDRLPKNESGKVMKQSLKAPGDIPL